MDSKSGSVVVLSECVVSETAGNFMSVGPRTVMRSDFIFFFYAFWFLEEKGTGFEFGGDCDIGLDGGVRHVGHALK